MSQHLSLLVQTALHTMSKLCISNYKAEMEAYLKLYLNSSSSTKSCNLNKIMVLSFFQLRQQSITPITTPMTLTQETKKMLTKWFTSGPCGISHDSYKTGLTVIKCMDSFEERERSCCLGIYCTREAGD